MKEERGGGESLRMRKRRKRESALREARAKLALFMRLLPFRCGNVECRITECTSKNFSMLLLTASVNSTF